MVSAKGGRFREFKIMAAADLKRVVRKRLKWSAKPVYQSPAVMSYGLRNKGGLKSEIPR